MATAGTPAGTPAGSGCATSLTRGGPAGGEVCRGFTLPLDDDHMAGDEDWVPSIRALAIPSHRADTLPAVSGQNVSAIRRLLDAFNRGQFAALDDVDPEAELQDEPRIPGAGWNYGHQGAIDWATKLWQSFEGLSLAIADEIEQGDRVVARWRASGTGKRSGIDVEMGGYCAFEMRAGKVRRVEFYESRDEAHGTLRSGREASGTPYAPRQPA
jgi:ketosteroid isomerase-like protein